MTYTPFFKSDSAIFTAGVASPTGPGPADHASPAQAGAAPGAGIRDEGFGFETMFMAVAEDGKPLDVAGIRGYYESIGESVLVGVV